VEVTVRPDEYRRLQKVCLNVAHQCDAEGLQTRWLKIVETLDLANDTENFWRLLVEQSRRKERISRNKQAI
jgi:hypothetical protein